MKLKYHIDQWIMGILLLTIGIGYLGDQLQAWDFTMFFPGWWSFFITLPALSCIVKYGVRLTNGCFLLVGLYLWADANGWIGFHISWTMILALACIITGLRILFRKKVHYYDYRFF